MNTKTVEEWETILRDGCFITSNVRESIRQVAKLIHGQINQAMTKRPKETEKRDRAAQRLTSETPRNESRTATRM